MRVPQWQNRRSDFNHTELKNKYIRDLAAWINLLDGLIENSDVENTYVDFMLPAWNSLKDEAYALFKDFENEMTPRVLFKEYPLNNCDEDTKQWLGDLIHNLWLVRYSVNQLVSDAADCTARTDIAYYNLREALNGCLDIKKTEALKPFRAYFSELLMNCRLLARAIEKFPSEVLSV